MSKKNEGLFLKMIKKIRWISFISSRFSTVDRKGKTALTSFLGSLGISCGVMTLICVLGVMNGFQGSTIKSIISVSSSHIQVTDVDKSIETDFESFCSGNEQIVSCVKYYESQGLIVSSQGNQAAAVIRGVDEKIIYKDLDFASQIYMEAGNFNLSEENSIVLGSSLARNLGVTLGSEINILALSGSTDISLISNNRKFIVCGLFNTGNPDINENFAFTGLKSAEKYFGKGAKAVFAIKINDYREDSDVIALIKKNFSSVKCDSWKNFNKSFFSTLRIEKNMLFLLILIIFIVVGINIYNSIRRLVYERSSEISTLSALGAGTKDISSIFIVRGLSSGIKGSFFGVLAGLLLVKNMGTIFTWLSQAEFQFQKFITIILAPENLMYLQKNRSFEIYASIPAEISISELLFISLFGILTPLISSWIASRNVLKMNICEVLHEN